MTKEDVTERLGFASGRLNELLTLNGGNLAGASASVRQQLMQEFLFHLIGATEVLAQLVNDARQMGIPFEDVSIRSVVAKLPQSDPLRGTLSDLHTNVRKHPFPLSPYTDEAYVYRALNYRHQVTHRRRNPFLFRVGSVPSASLMLDPRDISLGPSLRAAQDELLQMLKIISGCCSDAFVLL